MGRSLTVGNRQGWRYWAFPAVFVTLLSGTGPCYNDECSNPGEGWCDGQTARSCEGAGQNSAYWLAEHDCTGENLACVEGFVKGYAGEKKPQAWCLDIQECESLGSFHCGISAADGTPMLMQCRDVSKSEWWGYNQVAQLGTASAIKLVLSPLDDPGFGFPTEKALPCVSCSSTCGCDLDSVCRDGLCVPVDVTGEAEEGLACCGRERETSCLKGAPCEKLDGTQGFCDKGARCDPCQAAADCESDLLGCVSTGGGLPAVCLSSEEAQQALYDCREDLNEAWRIDACGNWVELAADVVISYSCREGTDQSWSLNACDQWISVAKDCGEGYRCEANRGSRGRPGQAPHPLERRGRT